jgi:hypothetical protein
MDDESISTTFRLSGLNFYVGSFEMNGEESSVWSRAVMVGEGDREHLLLCTTIPTHPTHHVSEGVVPAAN